MAALELSAAFRYLVSMELNDPVVQQSLQELCGGLAKTDDPKFVADFLDCLLTESERVEIALRWALVKEIEQGTTQRDIAKMYGLSLCKITRGSKELKKEDSAFKRMLHVVQGGAPSEPAALP